MDEIMNTIIALNEDLKAQNEIVTVDFSGGKIRVTLKSGAFFRQFPYQYNMEANDEFLHFTATSEDVIYNTCLSKNPMGD